MKKNLSLPLLILSIVLYSHQGVAQKAPVKTSDVKADPSMMVGGLGMTWIDGKAYYLVNLSPEISFWKIGVGLDLNFYISSDDQSVRWEELQYGRFIRYIRYGHKGDDIYARLGVLDNSRLGHGFLMYMYKNSPSQQERRLGSEFDLNFEKYGFETIYSDFARAGVVGMRAYAKPLQFTTLRSVPILGGLEVGASWVGDVRSDSKIDSIRATAGAMPGAPPVITPAADGTMSEIGFDIGLPLLRIPTVSSTLYFDYGKIISYGSGLAFGLETNFSGLGLLNIYTKLERRYSGDQFMPNYFNSFYELERKQLTDTMYVSKAYQLKNLYSPGWGYFGDLTLDFLGTFKIQGTFQKLDNYPESGLLHFGTSLGEKIPLVVADVGYDKRNIKDTKDLFTLDERSLLYANIGYKPYPFMIVSMLYTWTFAPAADASGNISYQPQKRVTPKVSLVFPL